MDSPRFDRLSRVLGRGTSRRATLGLLGGLAAGVVGSRVARADSSRPDVVDFCKFLDAEGALADLGVTLGECNNIFFEQASDNATNFIAGICGNEEVQAELGATNKGQCIKAARSL